VLTSRPLSSGGTSSALCVNPACFRWGTTLLDFATAAAGAGFDRVEVSIQQALALAEDLGGAGALAMRLADLNLKVEQFSGLLPAGPVLPAPLLVDEAEWQSAWITMDERLDVAAALGCQRAAVVCNPRTDAPEANARRAAIERLRLLADRVAPYGVSLAVEFIGVRSGLDPALDGQHPFVADLAGVVELVEQVSRPNVGLLLDNCHLYASCTTPNQIKEKCSGLIEFVQVSDVPAGVDPADMCDEIRCPPGEGALDLPALLASITGSGYSGPLSIELFSPAIWSLNPAEAARRLFTAAVDGLGAVRRRGRHATEEGS
jgi:sugar phosphate isomerase/epimerase